MLYDFCTRHDKLQFSMFNIDLNKINKLCVCVCVCFMVFVLLFSFVDLLLNFDRGA